MADQNSRGSYATGIQADLRAPAPSTLPPHPSPTRGISTDPDPDLPRGHIILARTISRGKRRFLVFSRLKEPMVVGAPEDYQSRNLSISNKFAIYWIAYDFECLMIVYSQPLMIEPLLIKCSSYIDILL
jgi:hypothetical protein